MYSHITVSPMLMTVTVTLGTSQSNSLLLPICLIRLLAVIKTEYHSAPLSRVHHLLML